MKKFIAILSLLMVCLLMAGCEEYTEGFDDIKPGGGDTTEPDGNGDGGTTNPGPGTGGDGSGDSTDPEGDLIVTPTNLEEFLVWISQDEANASAVLIMDASLLGGGKQKTVTDIDGENTKADVYEFNPLTEEFQFAGSMYTYEGFDYTETSEGWIKTPTAEEDAEPAPTDGLTVEDFTLVEGSYVCPNPDGSIITITFNEDGSINLTLSIMFPANEEMTEFITFVMMDATFSNFGNVTVTLPDNLKDL